MNETNLSFRPAGTDIDLETVKKREKILTVIRNAFSYVFLTVCAVFSFLPFYWMIISSLKTEAEYRDPTISFFPKAFRFENYSFVLNSSKNGGFSQSLVNTLIVGGISTILGLIIIILTAYALARMNFKGKNLLFTLMLGTMMIPGEMYTLTNYLTVMKWHWKDTYTILILPFLVSIYYIYLLRNNFMQIPESLYKAAKVDGLSDLGYLVKVMVPLTAPTLISITLLKFIGTWNSYIWPQLVNSEKWQMITNWVSRGFTDPSSIYGTESLQTLKMAAVCMVSLPLLILFICFRKYIMHGVSKSGTKG